jgi:hypothetical protein
MTLEGRALPLLLLLLLPWLLLEGVRQLGMRTALQTLSTSCCCMCRLVAACHWLCSDPTSVLLACSYTPQ